MKDTISVAGGKVSEDGVVESFNNDDEALDAFDNGVVVCNSTSNFEAALWLYAIWFLFDQNVIIGCGPLAFWQNTRYILVYLLCFFRHEICSNSLITVSF